MSEEENAENTSKTVTCRILVIGLHPKRVSKVLSMIQQILNGSSLDELRHYVDFLGCVAKFGQYPMGSKMVRYLTSVDVVGDIQPASSNLLLEFFEQVNANRTIDENTTTENCVFGVAIIDTGHVVKDENATAKDENDDDDDVSKIIAYVRSMTSSSENSAIMPNIVSIAPNPEFSSIQEELAYYKDLPEEEKEEATRQQTLGPGKMAKFVIDIAKSLLEEPSTKKDDELKCDQRNSKDSSHNAPVRQQPPRVIDPNKTRYCCRMCRCILFGQDDLQDPPHMPSQHQFSHRKHNHRKSQDMCQSYFLQERLDFMIMQSVIATSDNDENEDAAVRAAEGKFSCPKCHTKLGSWHLYGAQCSCGTWVVPAIQIPQSKIDPILPTPLASTLKNHEPINENCEINIEFQVHAGKTV